MRRSSGSSEQARRRVLPWALLLRMGLVVGRRVSELSEKDRSRLVILLRDSRGWPGKLSGREREELRRLIGKLDAVGMGREMLPLLGAGRRGRRRH